MSTSALTRPTATARWRLGRRGRRLLLTLHIASGGIWLGIDLVMGLLLLRSWLSPDPQVAAATFRVLVLVGVAPMLTVSLVCLASGVLLGLGTKYGLVRYRWVLVKLVIAVVMILLNVVSLRPGLNDLAEQGKGILDGLAAPTFTSDMAFPPLVSTTALSTAILLSVFKPWGRVRREGARKGQDR